MNATANAGSSGTPRGGAGAASGGVAGGVTSSSSTGGGGLTVTGGATSGGSPAGSGTGGTLAGGSSAAGGSTNPQHAGATNAAAGGASPISGGSPGAGGSSNAGNGASSGAGGTTGQGALTALDLVVAPDGKDTAPGTLAEPTTLTTALTRVSSGHSIFMRGGKYSFAAQITIARENSGTSARPKVVTTYPGEHPILDFSAQPYGAASNPRGLQVNGSFWHIRGLEVVGAADNGIYVAGNSNVIENCVMHGNRDTGLQLGRASSDLSDPADWPANNLVLNCESYDNYDAPPGSGENADGFAAKLTVGAGNIFRGCVAHHNIDDGWDLYTKTDTGPIGAVTIDQSIAYANGTLTNGTTNDNGDRNGFKLGGEDIAVAHVVTRSIAFGNGKNGFTWNSNPGAIRMFNNLAFDNAEGNFKFGDNSTQTAAVFTNNLSLWTFTATTQSDKAIGTDVANSNVWWDKSKSQPSINGKGLVATAADCARPLTNLQVTRGPDGAPNLSSFALAPGSDLIGSGSVPEGNLPFEKSTYYVGTPDLGAVEAR